MIHKINNVLKCQGVRGLLRTIGRRLFHTRARCAQTVEYLLKGKMGLEIGGPSSIFARARLLPIYPIVNRLDNCIFSKETIWKGNIVEGMTFRYDKKHNLGNQFIAEAVSLHMIPTGVYDFVLSSHTIKHIANPLQALSEWSRVLKDNGVLVLVVPHKDGTFDHKRSLTSITHLIKDLESKITEDDLTHLPEILELHDLRRDPYARNFLAFKERSLKNLYNRCLHHHVFDKRLVAEIVNYVGFQIYSLEVLKSQHIIVVSCKTPSGKLSNNQSFMDDKAV